MTRERRRIPPLEPRRLSETFVFCFSVWVFQMSLRVLFRARVADLAPLPSGAVILAPNHRSFIDPLVVGSLISEDLFFMMHAKYYDLPQLHWASNPAFATAE